MWYYPVLALALDFVMGDPPQFPHPVIGMGKLINKAEELLYPQEKATPSKFFVRGMLLALVVLTVVYLLSYSLLQLASSLHPYVGAFLQVWLIATTISAKGLEEAGSEIFLLLQEGKLREARAKVGLIVGRDTAQLEEAEVVRATIETVAENLVDGVIAPLFYAFLGGAPLALAYRAINTMDSMLGYKNSRYLYFGRFAARLDDVANFLPARLTGFFICLVALISPQLQAKGAWQAWREDAKKHPSPNSGIPEASVAGALGIRLGGVNYYQGIAQERAAMGPGRVPLAITHIKDTINIMYQAAILGAFLMIILYFNLLNKLGGGL